MGRLLVLLFICLIMKRQKKIKEQWNRDLKRIENKFDEIIGNMNSLEMRRPGVGSLNGYINNISSFYKDKYCGCTDQTLYMHKEFAGTTFDLVSDTFAGSLEQQWTFKMMYTGLPIPHNWINASSVSYPAQILKLDPWMGTRTRTWKD